MSVIHHPVCMVQPVKIISMDTLVNVNKDGKVSIVSWMLMSAYPTPAYMVSVYRRSPVLVIPAFASQDLWSAVSEFFQPVLMSGIASTQVQHPTLRLLELHEVPVDPLLKFVKVPLDGIQSFWYVICKLAEGALDLTVNVVDEDTEEHWSQELYMYIYRHR
ncbi:hypothetical protein WISP_117899 [Willisornis vidua]|uniref:Uncharacterized protein n=1 Tax=Willisornis vidua TaxID=1566151 RepID=A0ABQ9CWE2_9PASS|nr:hypothetical protein WISP_117899 [Willisornis vidua]